MNHLFVAAWLMGLLGSTHCVVMCGGIVAVSCSAIPLGRRKSAAAQVHYLFAYNAGRILSYAAGGAAAGAIGAAVASLASVERAALGLRLVAAVWMLLVGIYVMGARRALDWVERLVQPVWRRVAPLARRLLPRPSACSALALGLLWGFMPCGLVYAAFAAAATSGTPLRGAALMAAFGGGTLPMLLAMGSAAAAVSRMARIRWVRLAAGAVILSFGLLQIAQVGPAWASVGRAGSRPSCPLHHGTLAMQH
jgi:sulfite exporter TauE/SafE